MQLRRGTMKLKLAPKVVLSWLAVPLFLLSNASTVAMTDLESSPGPGVQVAEDNDNWQKPTFISNTILVKLTRQASASLRITGEDVNPAATGHPGLDIICRVHRVKSFRSIMTAGDHRDPGAAINSWYKLTLPGSKERVTLVKSTNDDALN